MSTKHTPSTDLSNDVVKDLVNTHYATAAVMIVSGNKDEAKAHFHHAKALEELLALRKRVAQLEDLLP